MYCKLTTYNKINVCGEGLKNPRYIVGLQGITPHHLQLTNFNNEIYCLNGKNRSSTCYAFLRKQ